MLLHRVRLNLRRKMRCDTAYPQHWWRQLADLVWTWLELACDVFDDQDFMLPVTSDYMFKNMIVLNLNLNGIKCS